jgi:hypothetical protein
MCRIDQQRSSSPDSGHNQGEDRVGTDTRERAQGKVLDDHQRDRRSLEGLGESGGATCQCWGSVGNQPKWKEGWPKWKKEDHGEIKHA